MEDIIQIVMEKFHSKNSVLRKNITHMQMLCVII